MRLGQKAGARFGDRPGYQSLTLDKRWRHRNCARRCHLIVSAQREAHLPTRRDPGCSVTPLRFVAAWIAAAAVLLIRLTCRIRYHDDPRPLLRAQSRAYAFAFLHAHQIATVVAAEPGTGAMVSRSADGQLLIPSLRVRHVVPIRGSTRRHGRDKGGVGALAALVRHARAGAPVYLAVDGPRGPRNHVRRGIAQLALEADAAVLVAVALPSRRWILRKTWDRFQIPKPFSRIDVFFDNPTFPCECGDADALRDLISLRLNALEAKHDAAEADRVCTGSSTPL
jgi:lysophospholipid acyltransferase (LPLAT)-like uncharacterized protein